ncbi:putative B-cell receptor-associated protein [Helianthus anomalus]
MTPLLFMVLAMEMGVIITMLFHSPLRNLIIMGLDRLKQGRGLVTSRTIFATLFIVFVFNVYDILKTQKRVIEVGTTNPTDQVLLANHILEASLMGFCLFLGLMIDRLHYYIKELWLLRKSLKVTRDSNPIHPVNKNKKA